MTPPTGRRWLLGVYGMPLAGVAVQVLFIMFVWHLPWYAVAIFVPVIWFQGYVVGASHGYRSGLWTHHDMARDAMRLQAEALIEATPPEIGETYTHLVTHRDRSN